jgi:hypothetical protein
MANVAFTCSSKIREQTVEMQGTRRTASGAVHAYSGCGGRACIVLAEWDSRALGRSSNLAAGRYVGQ